MKNSINIMELGVGVDNIVKGPKGKIIVECQKSGDRSILAGALKGNLGKQYKVFASNKKLPKIKIVEVEQKVERECEDEFIKKIIKQNELDMDRDTFKMQIVKMSKTGKNGKTIIMEVDPKTHKYFVEKARIKIGWKNCIVYDHVSVIRCYRCWGFNHHANDCRNKISCQKCGQEHDSQECKSAVKKCVNCTKMTEKYKIEDLDNNHEATYINCESYKRMVERNRKNIAYEE